MAKDLLVKEQLTQKCANADEGLSDCLGMIGNQRYTLQELKDTGLRFCSRKCAEHFFRRYEVLLTCESVARYIH